MNDEKIYLGDADFFVILLKRLYGKHKFLQYCSGYKTSQQWKETINEIFIAIEKCITNTIDCDDYTHKEELLALCCIAQQEITKAKTINKINITSILYLSKLSFNLIGDMPDNWDKKKVNKNQHWQLNAHRQIIYYQSNMHKANLIIDKAPSVNESSEYNNCSLSNKLHYDFNKDYARFIDWHKITYKEKHSELFP
jgi:hypothetical protein